MRAASVKLKSVEVRRKEREEKKGGTNKNATTTAWQRRRLDLAKEEAGKAGVYGAS